MGDFASGKWLLITTMYFGFLFLVTASVVDITGDNSIHNVNNVFAGATGDAGYNTNVSSSSDTTSYEKVKSTLSVLSGIGENNYDIGFPTAWVWLFNFIIFWIPLSMWLWSIYMAIPFLH